MKNSNEIEELRKELLDSFKEDDIFSSCDLAEKIIKLYEEDEKNSYEYCQDLYNLGVVQQKIGKYNLAVKYYKKITQILKKEAYDMANAEDSRNLKLIIDAENSIGVCYSKSAIRKSLALGSFEKAKALYKANFKTIDKQLIEITHNIGCAYYDMEKYDDAIYYHLEELAYRKEKDLHYIDNINFLGYSFEKKKDYTKAILYFSQALEIIKGLEGINSEEYISNLYYLSGVYFKQKDYQMAIKSYIEVSKLIEEKLGAEHPYVAEAFTRLAQSYLKDGDIEKALNIQLKSLNIIKQTVGEKHIYYSTALKRVADIYSILKDYEKAKYYYEKEYEIKEEVIGPYSDESVSSLLDNINIYIKTNDFEKEEKATEKLLKMVDFDLPKNSYKRALLILAKIYIINGRGKEIYDIYDIYKDLDRKATFDDMVQYAKEIDEDITSKEEKINSMFENYEDEEEDYDDYEEESLIEDIRGLFDGIKGEIEKIDKDEILEVINIDSNMSDDERKEKINIIENRIKEIQDKIVKELEQRKTESASDENREEPEERDDIQEPKED